MTDFDSLILHLITLTLLFVICLIITFKRQSSGDLPDKFLVMYFWTFFYTLLIAFIFVFGYGKYFPHLFRTAHITAVLAMPLSYLYIRQTLYPGKLRYTDLLHLLPALIFVVDYLPLFLLSANEKRALAEHMNGPQMRLLLTDGLFMPAYGHIIIRYCQMTLYFIAQVILIRKSSSEETNLIITENPPLWKWLKLLTGTQFIFFMGPLLSSFLGNNNVIMVFVNLSAIIVALVQCYFLVSNPSMLYGLIENYADPNINAQNSRVSEKGGAEMGLPDVQSTENPRVTANQYSSEILDEVGKSVEEHLQSQKPFLKVRYGIQDLARETGIRVHKISAYINRRHQMNFFNYINQLRINAFLDKIASNEQAQKTLEALAGECGFQGRSTFIRAFKKETGQTPSDYLSNSTQ